MAEEISLRAYKRSYRQIVKEEEKKSFSIHLVVFIIVNVLLTAINLIYSPGTLWFFYPLLGWGLGLAFHYLNAVHWIDKELREKEAQAEYLAKDNPIT